MFKIRKKLHMTIRQKILFSFLVMALGMLALNVVVVHDLRKYSLQYDEVVCRVAAANDLLPDAESNIGLEALYLAIERKNLSDTELPAKVVHLRKSLASLEQTTESLESKKQLRIASHTINTLDKYVNRLLMETQSGQRLYKREATVSEINSVSQLITDLIKNYISTELSYCEEVNATIQGKVQNLLIGNFAAIGVLLLMMVGALYIIIRSITGPISRLIKTTQKVAEGNFGVRVEDDGLDEVAVLGESFNQMVLKLGQLMDEVKESALSLRKTELKLMQAQINPHFLYNTLETIIWMAESDDKNKVIEIVQSLSTFFRITLSQGKDMIAIADELRHVDSYLSIQKIRYKDIMDYKIDVPEKLMGYHIQKLSLQPLVENALYHGIKNKRCFGTIRITGELTSEGDILLHVSDNGIGLTPDGLAQMRYRVTHKTAEEGGGFGLFNIQQRIALYYGDGYGLTMESSAGEGTCVTIRIKAE